MKSNQRALLGAIDQLLAHLEKRAEDPGNIEGQKSEHPTADLPGDDEASTGSHAEEVEQTLADQPNQGQIVDEANPGPSQNEVQPNIGVSAKETGTDPENETDSAKRTKDDSQYAGDTSHPARADSEKLAAFEKAAEQATAKGMALVASINNLLAAYGYPVQQQIQPHKKSAGDAKAKSQAQQSPKQVAELAGYDLAGALAGFPESDKMALDAAVLQDIAYVCHQATENAKRAAAFFDGYIETLVKAAEELAGGEVPIADVGGEQAAQQMGAEGPSPEEAAALAGALSEGGGAEEEPSPEELAALVEALSESEGGGGEEELSPEEAAALVEALSGDEGAGAAGEGQPSPEELDALVDVLGQLSQPAAEGAAPAAAEETKSSADKRAGASEEGRQKEARRKIARKLLEELLARSRG